MVQESSLGVTLTPKAAQRVQGLLAKRGGLGMRLAVKTSGCSGMAYALEFADTKQDGDLAFESHGVTVLVDPRSLPYLRGTELDFVREGLNEGFKFNNPNARNQCGCGESFTV
jgi:iron-sulfur cluster assembly protein